MVRTQRPLSCPTRPLLALWIAAVLLGLVGLGNVPLRDWDESIVARVSLEISRGNGHNLLLPTYLGRDYLNKPPGLHLAIAAVLKIWELARGDASAELPPEWLVRLLPALASSLIVPLMGLVQARIRPSRPDAAIATALITLTLLPLARHGRLAMLDGTQLTAMALVWLGVLWAGRSPRQALHGGLLAGLGGCLLLLLKAPVAPPVLAGALMLRWMDRDLDTRAWRWLLLGVMLALLPGVAWHGWHWLVRGSQALVMWGPQGLERLVRVVNGNGGGPMVPITQVLIGGWPWLPLLPAAMGRAWHERNRKEGRWGLGLFLLAGLLVLPLRTQLPWYSLLLWPPYALLCGPVLADLMAGRTRPALAAWVGRIWSGLGAVVLGAAIVLACLPGRPLPLAGLLSALPAGLALLAGGRLLLRPREPRAALRGVCTASFGWFLALGLLFAGPLWNWELAEQPPITPAVRLAFTGPAAPPVHLLEQDAESLRPSLHWYLNSPGAPLEPEASRWPRSRFRLISRTRPPTESASERCQLAQAGDDGWKRWDCKARGGAS